MAWRVFSVATMDPYGGDKLAPGQTELFSITVVPDAFLEYGIGLINRPRAKSIENYYSRTRYFEDCRHLLASFTLNCLKKVVVDKKSGIFISFSRSHHWSSLLLITFYSNFHVICQVSHAKRMLSLPQS